MRLNINRSLRIVLIAVLLLAICGFSFLLYREVKYPRFEEQKVPLYSYSNKATVGYRVYFKPNELYDVEFLEEDQIYLMEFIDHIKANFNYEFTADKDIHLRGSYNIIAKVQGYTTDRDDNVISIWEKDFTLVPQVYFTIEGKEKSIEESIDINLKKYNEFVTRILEASKANSQTRLNLIMNINLEGNTDRGIMEENIIPSLIIPLNTPIIEIAGNREIDKPGLIEETKKVQLPVNRNKVVLYGVIIGVLAIADAFLIFFTKGIIDRDPYEKTLKQIFKKHGDRLVALNSEIAATDESINFVKSIDELVRIADELGKPIMYKYSANYKDINRFCVIDEDETYILDLSNIIMKEKPNNAITVSNR